MSSEVKPHSRPPYIDYYDDDFLLLCDREDIVAKRNKDRVAGLRQFCDNLSALPYVITKKPHYNPRGYHRIDALKSSLKYNKLRDSSRIIFQPKLATHFHLLRPPFERTVHKRFEYCIVLDTLAMYDSRVPKTRKRVIRELESLRDEVWELDEDDMGNAELQERFDKLEEALWEEVGDLNRFVPAESDEIPPARDCWPAE